MYKTKFKRAQRFGKWSLFKFINAGGNGEVWSAEHTDDSSRIVAIKILINHQSKRYTRFVDEIKVLKENSDIRGLLQIIDYNLPANISSTAPWYTMPLAIPLTHYIKDKRPEQIIDVIISISQILVVLHSRRISHRDIKPPNILVKDDEFYLSDFGLVEYPDKKDITLKWEDVGPRWTIAPEMRRDPDKADGKLADVYSLAKTLWILLTKVQNSFEGQYSTNSSVELKRYVPSIYHASLDNLLHKSTDHNPSNRPSMKEFSDTLIQWKELNRNFEKRSKSEWHDIHNKLFPCASPKTVIWEKLEDIISILNIVSDYNQVNHTMFPDGGGLDLEGAKSSCEEDCIELNFNGQAHVMKPTRLIYECFPSHSDWNYFRLETNGLELIGSYEKQRFDEGLTELEPCLYTGYECYEFDDFNGSILPESARTVIRVAQGSFLICLRTGVYNKISSTYDGRHNKMTADEFRKYIESGIEQIDKSNDKTEIQGQPDASQFIKPRFIESSGIRKGARNLSAGEIVMLGNIICHFKEAKKEAKSLMKNTPFGKGGIINFADEKTYEAMRMYDLSPKPKNDEYEKLLKSLSDDDLAIVEAVMYGGRDAFIKGRAHPLDEMLEQFKHDSRKSRLYSILEKEPLDNYLNAGIQAYKG